MVLGCNTTVQSLLGNSFDVFCDRNFPDNDVQQLLMISDLPTCIDLCESWNAHNSSMGVCIGVALVLPGSPGVGCYLKSLMSGQGIRDIVPVDSARRVKSEVLHPLSISCFIELALIYRPLQVLLP